MSIDWPEKTDGVPRISPSALDKYLKCGESYRRKYVAGDRFFRSSIPLLVGKGVHKALEVDNGLKFNEGQSITIPEAKDVAVATFEEEYNEADEVAEWDAENYTHRKPTKVQKAQGVDRTAKTAETYTVETSPKIVPNLIEEPVVAQLPSDEFEGGAFQINGILDYTTEDGIGDLKTGKKAWSQDRVDGRLQLSVYGMMFRSRFGEWPRHLWVDNITHYVRKAPVYQRLMTRRDTDDYHVAIRQIVTALKGITSGTYLPAPEGVWWCSRRWCEFFDDCPFVAARRKKGE